MSLTASPKCVLLLQECVYNKYLLTLKYFYLWTKTDENGHKRTKSLNIVS